MFCRYCYQLNKKVSHADFNIVDIVQNGATMQRTGLLRAFARAGSLAVAL